MPPTNTKPEGCDPTPRPLPDAATLEAVGQQIQLACSFCHDRVRREDVTYCGSCLAPHHGDCFAEHGRCALPGCEETHMVRPALPRLEATAPPAPRLRRLVVRAVQAVAVCAALLVAAGMFSFSRRVSSLDYESTALGVAAPATPSEATITLRGTDLSVASLARQIAAVARRGITLSPEVEGQIDLDLRDVPWTEALAVVAEQSSLRVDVIAGGNLRLSRPRGVTLRAGTSLREAFVKLGLHANRNLVLGGDVQGEIRTTHTTVPWDVALLLLAAKHDLTVSRAGEVIHVTRELVPGATPLNAGGPRAWIDELQPVSRETRVSLEVSNETVPEILQRLQPHVPYELVWGDLPSAIVGGGGGGHVLDAESADFPAPDLEEAVADAPEPRFTFRLDETSWRSALDALCQQANLWHDQGANQIFLRPAEPTVFRAAYVDVRAWLSGLAELAGTEVELADDVQGILWAQLDGVSYRQALVATAKGHGLSVEATTSGGYRVRVDPNRAVATTPLPDRVLSGVSLAGTEFRATAVLLGGPDSDSIAILNGEVYYEGDALYGPDGELPNLIVDEIRDDLVSIEVTDSEGDVEYRQLVLDY